MKSLKFRNGYIHIILVQLCLLFHNSRHTCRYTVLMFQFEYVMLSLLEAGNGTKILCGCMCCPGVYICPHSRVSTEAVYTPVTR